MPESQLLQADLEENHPELLEYLEEFAQDGSGLDLETALEEFKEVTKDELLNNPSYLKRVLNNLDILELLAKMEGGM